MQAKALRRQVDPPRCRLALLAEGPRFGGRRVSAAELTLIGFDDLLAAVQLRDLTYRRPGRANRFLSQCPVCRAENGVTDLALQVLGQQGYVGMRCDNGCLEREILDALHLDGILATPQTSGDLDTKHGGQVRIAYLLAEHYRDRLIHVTGIGWLHWTGKQWRADAGDKRARECVLRTLRIALDTLDPKLQKIVAKCESANAIAGILQIAASLPQFRVEADELDANPYLVNCANGTLDLHTMELRQPEPSDLITKKTEAAYYGDDCHSRAWAAFVEQVLPDVEVREYLRRVLGMAVLGKVEEHILPVLTGVGANGKTTAAEAVLYALGDYAMTGDPHLFTAGETSSVGQVDLMGRRLVFVSETDKGAKLADATVKRLTGGDRIKARKLYQNFVEFTPSHTAFLITNHPPAAPGDDDALWRRLRVIPFDVVIPESQRDGRLPDRLKIDADAILSWILDGYADYVTCGLDEPDAVKLSTDAYRHRSDHLGRFIDECCVTSSPVQKASQQALFDAWSRWAAAEGAELLGRNGFAEAVEKRGFARKPSGGKNWFHGIALAVEVER